MAEREQNGTVTIKDPTKPASYGQRGYIGGLLIDAIYGEGKFTKGDASQMIQALTHDDEGIRKTALGSIGQQATKAAK